MEFIEFIDNNLKPDSRTKNFPMLSTSLIPISLCIIYIIIVVFVGPYYMANKKPFTLKNTILIYNIGQIFACTYIVIELLKSGPKFGCDSLNEDVDDPITLHITETIWWASILKLAEFFETIFFILRKKQNQISGLHIYHHVTTYLIIWTASRVHPGGTARIIILVNNLVHMIMYSYYLLSSMGREIQQKLNKYKKYITIIQMVQFCFFIINTLFYLVDGCPIPTYFVFIFIPNVIIVLYMFYNFYRKSYISKFNKIKLKT